MKIKMIWSQTDLGVIAVDDKLIHTTKQDFENFKKLTIGNGNNAVLMGSTTYKTLGKYPLWNRLNLVLTSNKQFPLETEEDTQLVHSVKEAIELCEANNIDELWIIGGANIYKQFLPLADELVVTHWREGYLYSNPTIFKADLSHFNLTKKEPYLEKDMVSKHSIYYEISYYERKH